MSRHKLAPALRLIVTGLPKRVARSLLLALILTGFGGIVMALAEHRSTGALHTRTSAASTRNTDAAATLLPTITVHPQPEIPTLAVVSVWSNDSRRSADAKDATPSARVLPVPPSASFAAGAASGSGFVMPYYSFGRSLRPANKE